MIKFECLVFFWGILGKILRCVDVESLYIEAVLQVIPLAILNHVNQQSTQSALRDNLLGLTCLVGAVELYYIIQIRCLEGHP